MSCQAWKFKPRVVQAPSSATLPPVIAGGGGGGDGGGVGRGNDNLPPLAVFIRPLAANDVFAPSNGRHIVDAAQAVVLQQTQTTTTGTSSTTPAASQAATTSPQPQPDGLGLGRQQRCRLWWRYAGRATVLQVRRRWGTAAMQELMELMDRNFRTSLQVREYMSQPPLRGRGARHPTQTGLQCRGVRAVVSVVVWWWWRWR